MMEKSHLKRRKQVQAVMAISLMLIAGIGAGIAYELSEEEESSAFDPFSLTAIAAFIIIAYAAGILAGWWLNEIFDKGDGGNAPQVARQGEANLIASSILQGVAYQTNGVNVLSDTWGLTHEHFIRYAELAASFLWGPNETYNANEILSGSAAYLNAAVGVANSSVQTSQLFHYVSERLDMWNTMTETNAYRNTMTVSWVYGSSSFGSKTSFDGYLTSVTTSAAGANRVYISDVESLWVFGASGATITSLEGQVVNLHQGENDLTSGFKPGVYTLQNGITYAGPMVYVIDPQAAQVRAGIVMEAGGQTKLAIANSSGGVTVDGNQYNSLGISVKPDDGTAQIANILPFLTNLSKMMVTVNQTLMSANAAASAVWNIFDIMGAASIYLTTLMIPDNYENIDINQGQKSLMTVVALNQLVGFFQSGKDKIMATDFKLSSDSLTLFCRGDIYNKNGKMLYQNVIFTPLFYNSDVTLRSGSNLTDQPSIIAIWETSGTNLSSWNLTSNAETAMAPGLETGGTIYIYEMKLGGSFVSSALLKVRHINYIKGEEWDQIKPPIPTPPKKTDWTAIIIMIIGIVLLLIGVFVPAIRPIAYLGIVLVIIGGAMYVMSSFSIWDTLFTIRPSLAGGPP